MAIAANFPSIKPALNLDFANVGRLDPRVTFARASTARYYDGVTTAKAEENLLLYSQGFDNAYWTKNDVSVTANTEVAPDGTTTAETITASATTSSHDIDPNSTTFPALTQTDNTISVFAKKGTLNYFQILVLNQSTAFANFDLDAGVIGTTGGLVSSSIASAGNGWYRCSITVNVTGTLRRPAFGLVSSDSAVRRESWTAAGTETVYLWGAQLEQRSAVTAYTATTTQPITNYVPVLLAAQNNEARFDHTPTTGAALGLEIEEQRTNLLTYSDDFANAAWSKTRSSITSNTIVAPDGTLTGDKLVEDTQTGAHHINVGSFSFTSGTSYTLSGYYKAAERTRVQLQLGSNGTPFPTGLDHRAIFDLTTGTLVSAGASLTSTSITSVGNGWYRCSITAVAQATATDTVFFAFLVSSGTTTSYTGDGYSGVFIWGAQLEEGAFATSYIPTTTTALTRSADAASMTGTNFSEWFNAAAGTFYADAERTSANSSSFVAFAVGQNSDNFITTQFASSALVSPNGTWASRIRSTGDTPFTNITPSPVVTTNSAKIALSKNGTAYALSVNGGAIATFGPSGNTPSTTEARIGNGFTGSVQGSGYIKRIAYYPVNLSNAQLQALTG